MIVKRVKKDVGILFAWKIHYIDFRKIIEQSLVLTKTLLWYFFDINGKSLFEVVKLISHIPVSFVILLYWSYNVLNIKVSNYMFWENKSYQHHKNKNEKRLNYWIQSKYVKIISRISFLFLRTMSFECKNTDKKPPSIKENCMLRKV